MTSTLKPAPSDRTLRGLATRRPEWFAVLTSLAYVLPLLVLAFLGQEHPSITAWLAEDAWKVLVPATLLTVLGWWGVAGFTRRSTWRSLVPVLPLILLYGLSPALGLLSGVVSHSFGYVTLVAANALAVGFGYEATFRGLVLQTLLPRGTMRAVLLSSVLFGAAYVGNELAAGLDPVLGGVQAVNMVGMGVAFAAVVVVTGTIWPLVLIDAAMQVPFFFVAGANSRPGIFIVIEPAMGALVAAYGLWLLHRHQHRPAEHSGEDGQFSPPREPRQPSRGKLDGVS